MKKTLMIRMLFAIKKKLWLIVLVGMLFGGATYAYSSRNTVPIYRSDSLLLVNSGTFEYHYQTLREISTAELLMPTILEVSRSKHMMSAVSEALPFKPSAKALQSIIWVAAHDEGETIKVVVRGRDPQLITDICNVYTKVFIEEIENMFGISYIHVLDPAEVPNDPISTSPLRKSIYVACMGMGIIIAIIALMCYLDGTIKVRDEVQDILGLAVLGTIPTHD